MMDHLTGKKLPGEYRARKGDICAVSKRHSSTSVGYQTSERWEWHIGRVISASRDGVIKSVVAYDKAENGEIWELKEREYDRNSWWRALTISSQEYRDAAAKLIGRVFPTQENLKANIIGELG